jgi:hypothetical protein
MIRGVKVEWRLPTLASAALLLTVFEWHNLTLGFSEGRVWLPPVLGLAARTAAYIVAWDGAIQFIILQKGGFRDFWITPRYTHSSKAILAHKEHSGNSCAHFHPFLPKDHGCVS